MSPRLALAALFALSALGGPLAGCVPAPTARAEPEPEPAASPGVAPGSDDPESNDPESNDPESPVVLGPDGCPASPVAEPEMPAEPMDFTLAELLGPDGAAVGRTRRTTTRRGGVAETLTESADAAGQLWHRRVERRADEHLLFESSTRLDLPLDGTLPDTYGQPASWSVAYTWDAADHVVELVRDLALDGRADSGETWRFDARGTVREHRETSDGALYRVETFDAAGRPLESLDVENNGRVWTYTRDGRLLRDALLTRGETTSYTDWDMAAPERPRAFRSVELQIDARGARHEVTVGERRWTYDAAARPRSAEGWHRVDGFDRHGREDFDEAGRVVYSREDTEDASCRRYEQRTTFADGPAGAPAVMLDQMTTCDGALFEHIRTDVDAAGRPVRVERVFAGNPRQTTHQLDEFAYDRCGAVEWEAHHWDERLTRRVTNRRDAWGRLVERITESMGGAPSTTLYAWDAAGRLTRMGERRWTYDGEGRMTRVDFGAEATAREFDGPVVAAVRYTHGTAPAP